MKMFRVVFPILATMAFAQSLSAAMQCRYYLADVDVSRLQTSAKEVDGEIQVVAMDPKFSKNIARLEASVDEAGRVVIDIVLVNYIYRNRGVYRALLAELVSNMPPDQVLRRSLVEDNKQAFIDAYNKISDPKSLQYQAFLNEAERNTWAITQTPAYKATAPLGFTKILDLNIKWMQNKKDVDIDVDLARP